MWSIIGAIVSSIVGAATSYFSNSHVSGRDVDFMSYNSSEAATNREFQSAQTQLARQWQEDMYNKYQSPSAMVRQYQQAGLNPALMYSRGATPVSFSSTSVPSGSTASASAAPLAGIDSLINSLSKLVSLPSELQLLKAQTESVRSSTMGQNIQNSFSPAILQQNLQQGHFNILNSQAALVTASYNWNLMDSETQLNYVKGQLTESQIKDVLASADLKTKQAATEALKQANLSVTNEYIAAQIITERMKPALLAAQTYLNRQQGDSVKADVFQKNLVNAISDKTGIPSSVSWPQLLFGVAGAFIKRPSMLFGLPGLALDSSGSDLSNVGDWLTKKFGIDSLYPRNVGRFVGRKIGSYYRSRNN